MRAETFTNRRTGTIYHRINRAQAFKLYAEGHTLIIAPCMVNMSNPYHHFWAIMEYNGIDGNQPAQDFERITNSYTYYNCCRELGLYPKFFAPASIAGR